MIGTNFSWKTPNFERHTVKIILPTGKEKEFDTTPVIDDMDPDVHIGKRSAAGGYCWDCNITLCKDGEDYVHYTHRIPDVSWDHAGSFNHQAYPKVEWLDHCPKCGKAEGDRSITKGASAVELGFAKPNSNRPRGVGTCSSFGWAQDPEEVKRVCLEHLDEYLIEDEYGRAYTCRDFLDMIEYNCPIQSTRSVGHHFS